MQNKIRQLATQLAEKWQDRGVPKDQPFTRVRPTGLDYRGIPTTSCLCGGRTFMTLVSVDPECYEIEAWDLCGLCFNCGALVTVACPADLVDRGIS